MSPTNNNTHGSDADKPGPHAPTDPADQLAHELANLLDGSLRHLGIVINTLRETDPPDPDHPETDHADPATPGTPQAILARLKTTDKAMRQMVTLIHAWMKKAPQPREMFDQSQTLKQMLEQVIQLHRPAATSLGIELSLTLGEDAADIPTGPIFPIAANALRNSIEAIADADIQSIPGPLWIDVNASLEIDQVRLTVSDNGPGPDPSMCDPRGQLRFGRSTKPHGHGLGLTLSQQIAHSLQGSLELIPRPPRGAQLTLRCPLTSLSPHSQSTHPADAT